jgi:hypothetical protein
MTDLNLPDYRATSITQFRNAILARKGIQQPGKYVVQMIDGGFNTLSCYPESVTLPQRSFSTAPYSPWGPILQLPVRREYGECAMSFIIYQDWAERRFLENWMDKIIPPKSTEDADPVGVSALERIGGPAIGNIFDVLTGANRTIKTTKYSDYTNSFNTFTGTINIYPLTVENQAKETCIITLKNAFPLTITPTQMSSEASGYTTFVAIFAFKEYEFI